MKSVVKTTIFLGLAGGLLWCGLLFAGDSLTWAKALAGGKDVSSQLMSATKDGGLVVLGTAKSDEGADDLFLTKFSAGGGVQWQRFFSNPHYKFFHGLIQTRDGGFVCVGGHDTDETFGEAVMLKFRPDGALEWQQRYSGPLDESLEGVMEDDAGNLIAVGASSSFSFAHNVQNGVIIKTDSRGKILWQRHYGSPSGEHFWGIIKEKDGYVISGTASARGSRDDLWMLKVKEDGGILWQKTYGGGGDESPLSFKQTSDGNYVLADRTTSFKGKRTDVWIFKLNPSGDILWHTLFAAPIEIEFPSLGELDDGSLLLSTTSYFKSPKSGNDTHACVLKMNKQGQVAWQKRFNSKRAEQTAPNGQSLVILGGQHAVAAFDSLSFNEEIRTDIVLVRLGEEFVKQLLDSNFTVSSPKLQSGTGRGKFASSGLKAVSGEFKEIPRKLAVSDVLSMLAAPSR